VFKVLINYYNYCTVGGEGRAAGP